MMDPVFALVQAREGRLRMLAVSTAKRMQAVPDLPTMTEQGVPGMELFGWFAAMVPIGDAAADRRSAQQVVQRDRGDRRDARNSSTSSAAIPWITTPEEGQAQLIKDQKDWEGYVKAAKIEPQG